MATEKSASEVKYLLLPISVNPSVDGMTPNEAQDVVKGYLNQGFVIISTTVTGVGANGMTVAHVLVK